MVSRDHKLSMRKQCELLQLSRSRLSVSRGYHGLAQTQSAFMAAVQQHGCRLLRLGFERGARQVRHAGNPQHRSGQAIYQRRLDRRAGRRRHQNQHGRKRRMARQPDDRTAVAVAEV